MVSWKVMVILITTAFLLIVGLAAQQGIDLLNLILPHRDVIAGQTLCKVGGFIANPFIHIGSIKIPLIDTDGAIFASSFTIILAALYKRFITKIKWFLVAILITWFSLFFLYKSIGIVMVYFAETKYGMSGCAEFVSFPFGINIEYRWFSPMFFLFAFLTLMGLILTVIKLTKGMKK